MNKMKNEECRMKNKKMKDEECRMKNVFYLHPDDIILHSTFFILHLSEATILHLNYFLTGS